MNNAIIIGNLARDPELRYTNSGKAVCNFTLAVSKGFGKDKEAEFINCVAWEKTAENICNYMAKGSKMAVQGRIQVSTYDKDGEKRYKTEVVAGQVEFLSKAEQQVAPERDSQQEAANRSESMSSRDKETDDQTELADFQEAIGNMSEEDLPF